MDGETLSVTDQVQIQVARLLCLLGAILVALYGSLYGAVNFGVSKSVQWVHLGAAGLLIVLLGASYVSRTIRRLHVEITWGLLCCMMAGTAVLAAANNLAGEYALGLLLVYAVFGLLMALVGTSLRPVWAFLSVGGLCVGGALLWTPTPQVNPWALGGSLVVVALVEGIATRWALSVRRRLAAQAHDLREQRALSNRLLESSPHAILRVAPSGTLIDASTGAEDVLDRRTRTALGGPDDRAERNGVPPENASLDESHPFSQVLQEGREIHAQEYSVDGPDSSQRVLSVTGAPIRDTDGTIREGIFHLVDVTDRKERKQALQQAKEDAAGADRLKSALLANMSHEIRTPLTAIIGFADAIGTKATELELPDDSSLPGYADLIEQSGKRLLETLEGVLDLSQLEAGHMELAAETVDLDDQARRAVEEYRSDAQANDIDLQLDAADTTALADADGVRIVLDNLLDNAIKYTDEGGTVQVRTYPEAEWAVLEIEDTGAGMEPEKVDQLFEPFRQASTGLSREYEGAGIGLAVTKKATEKMGGSMEVATEKGTGSRFLARLPLPDGSEEGRRDSPSEQAEAEVHSC
jgi:PAS domain S-box-containing protein